MKTGIDSRPPFTSSLFGFLLKIQDVKYELFQIRAAYRMVIVSI